MKIVTTEQELVTALEVDRTICLGADVTLSRPLELRRPVRLDGGGYWIRQGSLGLFSAEVWLERLRVRDCDVEFTGNVGRCRIDYGHFFRCSLQATTLVVNVWASSFNDLTFNESPGPAIYIANTGRGTGNVFSNISILRPHDRAIYTSSTAGDSFNVVKIESASVLCPLITLHECGQTVIDGLHFENVRAPTLLAVSGQTSRPTIRGNLGTNVVGDLVTLAPGSGAECSLLRIRP